jgi:hypothetical protein
MHDSLRVLGLIPSVEPYSTAPYFQTPINDNSGKNLGPTALNATGPDAIVDWILLEVRDASTMAKVATRRALVQRDGEIVDTNGVSPVVFSTVAPGNYFVSVKHRNHLGVMTLNPVALTLSGGPIDFTQQFLWTKPASPAIVNAPARVYGLTQVLWAGDARANKNTKYNGFQNDKEAVLAIVSPNFNGSVPGYRVEDVNMDGKVRYNNTDNDRNVILFTVTVATPNAIYNQHTPD